MAVADFLGDDVRIACVECYESSCTVMLPCMSLLTGLNAALPKTSKRPVRASEASRNSEVDIALSLDSSIGTSVNDLLPLSKYVPPGGNAILGVVTLEDIRSLRRGSQEVKWVRHWL